MAQVPVSMQVVIYPKDKSVKPYPATIVGYAWITGLAPDQGPIIPPEVAPPDTPGLWPPGSGIDMPEHPIVLPPVDPSPPDIPDPPDMVKPPPPQGGWAWGPNVGWIYVPGPGTPGPKK
jgi:hypothetical protein